METGLVKRRDFLRLSFVTSLSVMIGPSVLETLSAEECRAASGHWEETLNALADTYIPREPDVPGAAETCALELFLDPYHLFNLSIPLVVLGLDGLSVLRFGRRFKDLDLEQRTWVVEQKERIPIEREIYRLALALAKLSFYGAVVNDLGIRSIGFPGPSGGYPCTYSYNADPGCDESRLVNGNFP